MWKFHDEMPGRWLNRHEALDYLGISEAKFELLLAKGLIKSRGRGNGQRYDAERVHAVGILWKELDELLSEEQEEEPDERKK